ncbi:ribonuclease Z [Oceanobacillus piezotolerans]|uniref:Ribonuclease Z n=1 Tax=Oceanobacillus piezotolerans TaxID=2448030 RepID=A0A498DAX5_9BACI|nr:ribonuclease Z [Oceanobacillus piezotolerans]RLL48141.1 ribonuclease Z [Oceanobacillus piezotolerans]
MELTFLGTGAGLPSKERNVTAIVLSLLQEINHIWLFDCGEATQHQILQTSIKPRKINKIFITHLHGDHIYGLPGLLSSRSFQGGEEALTVYGPVGIKQYIETSLTLSESHLTYPLEIIEIDEGIIVEEEAFHVYAKKLDHAIPSFGYRIIEKDRPGELLVNKLMDLGIKPGPIYSKIKENPSVILDNGQVIFRKDVIGPNKKGRIVSILGDTRYRDEHIEFIKNSDVLVHEATFAQEHEELAKNYYHSTTTQTAALARNGNVKRLVLTHISSRYQNETTQSLLREAQELFENTVIAEDFYHTSIEYQQ